MQRNIFGKNRDKEISIAAFGILHSWKIEDITKEILDKFSDFYILGGTSFYSDNESCLWKNYPSSIFFIPQFCFVQKKDSSHFYLYFHKKNSENVVLDSTNFFKKFQKIVFSHNITKVQNIHFNPNFEQWKNLVEQVKSQIIEKKMKKIVLSREVQIELVEDIDIANFYFQLMQQYYTAGKTYLFYFQPNPENIFLCFSPERLYKKRGEYVITEAVAGCAPRSSNVRKDKILELNLLANPKEREEQTVVQNRILECLEKICDSHKILEKIKVMKLSYIQHLYSSFIGKIKV